MEGAGNAGWLEHPQPRAQSVGSTRVSHHRYPGTPGIPCAMVLTAYSVLSPATNSSCHRHRRIDGLGAPGRACQNLRRLDTSNGCQDHTALPYAESICRLRAVRSLTSREARPAITRAPDAAASTASRPNVRDDGQRPSLGTEWLKLVEVICPTGQAKYFLREGWTQTLQNCPSGKSVLSWADPAS
jgi:hypothetical protein